MESSRQYVCCISCIQVTALEAVFSDLLGLLKSDPTSFHCGNFGIILINAAFGTGAAAKKAKDVLEKMVEVTMMRGAKPACSQGTKMPRVGLKQDERCATGDRCSERRRGDLREKQPADERPGRRRPRHKPAIRMAPKALLNRRAVSGGEQQAD